MGSTKKFRYLIQRYFSEVKQKDHLVYLVAKDLGLLVLVLVKFILFLVFFTLARLVFVLPYYLGVVVCKYLIYYPVRYVVLKLFNFIPWCVSFLFHFKKLMFFTPLAYVFFFVFPKNKDLKFKEIFWYNNINRTNSLERDFLKYNASFSTFRHLKRFKPKKFLLSEKAFFRSINSHRVGVHHTTPHFISYGGRRDIYRANSYLKDVFSYTPNKHTGNSYFFDWFVKKNNTNFVKTSSELAFQANYGNPFNFSTKWYNNSTLPSKFKNLDSYVDSSVGDYSDNAYSSGRFMARRRGYKVLSPDISAGFLNLKSVWDGREDFEFWRNNYKNIPYYQQGKLQEYRKLLHLLTLKRPFVPKLYRTVGALFDKWSISRRERMYSQYGFSGERSLYSTYNFMFLSKIKNRADAAAVLRRNPIVNASTEDIMQSPNIQWAAPRYWRINLNSWGKVIGIDWFIQKVGDYCGKRRPYLDRSMIWLNYNKFYKVYTHSLVETIREFRRLEIEIEEFIVARATYMILTRILSPELNKKRFLWTHTFFIKHCLSNFIIPSRFFNNENFQIANFFSDNFSNSYQTFYKKEDLNRGPNHELTKRSYIYEQPFIVNWNNFNQFQNYSNLNSGLQIPYENVVKWKPLSNPFFRYTLFGRDSVFDSLVNLSNNTLYEKYTYSTIYSKGTKEDIGGFRNFFQESTFKNTGSIKRSREHLHLYFFKLNDVDDFASEAGLSLLKNSFLANTFANYREPKDKQQLKVLHSKKRHSEFSQSFLGREAVFGYQPGKSSKEYMFFNIYSQGKTGADFFESREIESLLERDAHQDSYEWMMDGIFRDGLFFLTKSAWSDLTNLIKNINFYNRSLRFKVKVLQKRVSDEEEENEGWGDDDVKNDEETSNKIKAYPKKYNYKKNIAQFEEKVSTDQDVFKKESEKVLRKGLSRVDKEIYEDCVTENRVASFFQLFALRNREKLEKFKKEVITGDFSQSAIENMILLGRKFHFRRRKIRTKMGRSLHGTLKPIYQPKRVTHHTPNWTLESGLDHMYLVWKNSKLSPIIYSPVRKRMTTADYWVLRRAFYKGFLSTSDIYRYLKTSRFLKKLRDVENKILNFIFNVLPSDFILVELKYFLLHFFLSFSFLDSFLVELSNFFSTDLMFLKNFFIRLLLCFSDQWLWFIFAYVKVSSSVCVNIFFDDIAGTFMFYSKSLDLYNTEAYVPIRKRGYRKAHRRYFRRQLIGRNRRLFQYKYSLDQLNNTGQPVDNFLTKRAFQFRRKFSLQNSYFLSFNLVDGFIRKVKTHLPISLKDGAVWFKENEDGKRVKVNFTYLNREQKNIFINEIREDVKELGWKGTRVRKKLRYLKYKIFKELRSSKYYKPRYKLHGIVPEDPNKDTFIEIEKSLYHKYARRNSYKRNKLFKRLKRKKYIRNFKPYEHLKLVRVAKFHSYSWRRLVIYHFSGRSKRRRKYFVRNNRFFLFSKYRRKKFVRSRIHYLKLFPNRLQYSFLGLMRYDNAFCTGVNFKNPLYLVDSKITTNLFSRQDVNSSNEISRRFFKFYNDSLRKRNFPLKFKYFYLFQYTRFLKSASSRGGEYALESHREYLFNKYRHRTKSIRLKNNTNVFTVNNVISREGSMRLVRRFDYDGDKFILPSFTEDAKSSRRKPKYRKLSTHIARQRRKRFGFIKGWKRYRPKRKFRSYKLLKIKEQIYLFIPLSVLYPLKQVFSLPFFLAKNYFFTSIFFYILISFLIVLLLSFRIAFNDLKYQISNQYHWSTQHSFFANFKFKDHKARFKLIFIRNVYLMLDFRGDIKHISDLVWNKIDHAVLNFRVNLISIQLGLLARLKASLNFKFWILNFIDNFFSFLGRVIKKTIQFIVFFITLALILAVLKNYLLLSGRYITHLPSMLLVVLFFILLIWFLSICSNKFVDNFLTSPYQAEQFLQENSGSYELSVEEEEIYELDENDIEEEQESFDEFPFYYHEDLLINNEFSTVQSDKIFAKKDLETYLDEHVENTYTISHFQFAAESLDQDIVAEFEEEESLKVLLFTSQLFSPRKRSRKKFLYKYDKDWWLDEEDCSEAHNAHFFYYYFGRSGFAEAYSSHIIDTTSDFRTFEEDLEEEDEWDIINIEYYDEESEDDSDLFDSVEFSEEHAVARLYHDRFFENMTLFNPSDTTFQPKDFYEFFADQEFGDAYVINDMGWVNELFFDRFLLDLNKDDIFMSHDQEIVSKISAYGFDQLDGNSLEFSNFRVLSLSLLKELKPSSVFSHTYFTTDLMGLVRNDPVFGRGIQDYDNFNTLNASWRVQFLFSNSALIINFNPYKFNIKDKLKIKSIPILGYEIFNNKYKRKFFKNPEYYVRLLSLKNYPELTYEEAERLWALLGCTRKEWDSIDNYLTDKMTVPYDNYDTPFAICALILGVYYNKLNMLNKNPRDRFHTYIDNEVFHSLYPRLKKFDTRRHNRGMPFHKENAYEYNPMLFFFDTVALVVNFLNDNLFFKGRVIINNHFLSPQKVELIHSIFKKLCFSFFLYTGFLVDLSAFYNLIDFNLFFIPENNSYLIFWYFYFNIASSISYTIHLFSLFFNYMTMSLFFGLSSFYLAQTFFFLIILFFVKLLYLILYLII